MTRPDMVRADSIDLQDRDAPSAQDHARLTTTGQKPSTNGALAPHQAETLREVAAETAEDRRVSWNNGDIGDLQLQQYADDLADVANSINQGQNLNGEKGKMSGHHQHDPLAVAQNGGHDIIEEDLDGEDDDMDDDMDKISSSPSIEDEDIDFEFVYALHTFVATVEGQANATKGDTMVLLDDSNSYWWLVRVVKDSSIGYLPAEHIETPTERLARLNKHRNIDLSATMLGDQAEKSKNPIKSAMRRRKAKTVTFAAPTYVDYSDIEYSTEEEDLEAEYFAQQQQLQQQQQQQQQATAQQSAAGDDVDDETAKVEPLKPKVQKDVKAVDPAREAVNGDISNGATAKKTSEEIFEASKSETPGPTKTKDGTVRDSFFKDETVETKKITLTPNLLRDDGAPRASTESKDLKPRQSFDKLLEKDGILSKEDKKKKDKKDKDKKAGGFRSLFSRKDKKRGDGEDDESIGGKRSMDIGYDGMEADEMTDDQPSPDKASMPQRQPSKLQKQQPRTEPSPTRKGPVQKEPATMRVVESDSQQDVQDSLQNGDLARSALQKDDKTGLSKLLPSRVQNGEVRPQKAAKATSRVEPDDFDSDDDDDDDDVVVVPQPTRQAPTADERTKQLQPQAQPQVQLRPTLPGAYPDSYQSTQTVVNAPIDRSANSSRQLQMEPRSESPANANNPPPLIVDTSSQEDQSSPISSPSPEFMDREDHSRAHRNQDSITTSTSAATASTWNDSNLHAFFDSSSEIRDLLVVVYDKTDVAPAGPDHPVAGTLFKEQNAKLAEITTQLDNMLGDWLARKQRTRGTL